MPRRKKSAGDNFKASIERRKKEGWDRKLYCHCRRLQADKWMVRCSAADCGITWFHVTCLDAESAAYWEQTAAETEEPEGNRRWYCSDCREDHDQIFLEKPKEVKAAERAAANAAARAKSKAWFDY
ncbi:hypothetical protein C8F01DRAFT_1146595 [Mycena amicta]|nr:hypothetical protein C8F01DRAFT_1146595 [Mycena amicta]